MIQPFRGWAGLSAMPLPAHFCFLFLSRSTGLSFLPGPEYPANRRPGKAELSTRTCSSRVREGKTRCPQVPPKPKISGKEPS